MQNSPNISTSDDSNDLVLPDPSPTMPDEVKRLDDIPAMCFKHAMDILKATNDPEKLNYGREAHIMDKPFEL